MVRDPTARERETRRDLGGEEEDLGECSERESELGTKGKGQRN